MNIHEYQAKAVLRKFGVPTSQGIVAFTAEEAETAAKSLDCSLFVVKAQIHAGGRGKAGGVKLTRDKNEVKQVKWISKNQVILGLPWRFPEEASKYASWILN